MKIRRAVVGDIDGLARLAVETYRAAFGESMSAADLAAHIERSLDAESIARMVCEDIVLVAQAEGALAGYAQIGEARLAEDRAAYGGWELRRIYVHGESQNQGIGAVLMEAALAEARAHGAERIFLDVWIKNDGARRFYERFGFRAAGERRFVVQSGAETDPDLIMVREISR